MNAARHRRLPERISDSRYMSNDALENVAQQGTSRFDVIEPCVLISM
jgi:hypothetical protein